MSAVVTEPVRRGVSVLRIGVFGVLLVALVASMLFAIGAGRFSVSVPRIIDILMAGALNPGLGPTQMDERI
ncbi:MAG: iron ABC transporter permease, partial [Rhizobium sp.]|nr:iron ABC transporter permease [Rhizobium sp.]